MLLGYFKEAIINGGYWWKAKDDARNGSSKPWKDKQGLEKEAKFVSGLYCAVLSIFVKY